MQIQYSICRLCLLLLAARTFAQDPRFRTQDGGEQKIRRKPKWSHFFVMREPRSQNRDQADGFFYQVGSGPPIVNRLKTPLSGYQSQTDNNNERYDPVIHSPYPNRHRTHQRFGSLMPSAFGARTSNQNNAPPPGEQIETGNPGDGTFRSGNSPDGSHFQSGSYGLPKQTENFPENSNGNPPLQLVPEDTAARSDTELLKMSEPITSHATLLHGIRKTENSPSDSHVSVEGQLQEAVFAKEGPRVFGNRRPLPSHLTPIVPPGQSDQFPDSLRSLNQKVRVAGDSSYENEKQRPSIALNIPTNIGNNPLILDSGYENEKQRPSIALNIQTNSGNIPLVSDRDLPEKNRFGLRLPDSDNSEKQLLDHSRTEVISDINTERPKAEISPELNKDLPDFVEKLEPGISHPEILQQPPYQDSEPLLLENEAQREREIINGELSKETLDQSSYGIDRTLDHDLPVKHEPTMNLREKEQPSEIQKKLGTSRWQSQPLLNSPLQEGTPLILFQDPRAQYGIRTDNKREQDLTNHGFSRKTKQPGHQEKESTSPYILPQKYNNRQQASNAFNPPNNINFNTNIHVLAGSPAPPSTDFQQEKQNQATHTLSVHPFTLRSPDSSSLHSSSQSDQQNSGRIPSNQIYFLRPSIASDIPLIIAEHPNGPYRQDNSGQTNIRTSRPSHLTAILPLSLGPTKENVGQRIQPNIYIPNANERTPGVDYSELLLRNQPQGSAVPSGNSESNTATHSIRLFLPQQQPPQYSEKPAAIQSAGHHVPNRFQTHQVNLVPNTHGYVQTQVQLPPLNFRFRLTPIKDELNGSFIDDSNSRKIAQPTAAFDGNVANLQPIPYQYQFPLQPIGIQGTHQVLFPNLQIPNFPTGIPTVLSERGQLNITESAVEREDLEEKSKEVSEPSDVGNAFENVSASDDLSLRKEDTQNDTKEDISIELFTTDEFKADKESTTIAPKVVSTQQFSDVVYSDDKREINITRNDDSIPQITTESQSSTRKPSSRLLAVITFTEATKTEDNAEIQSEGGKTTETTLVGKKRDPISDDSDNPSLSKDVQDSPSRNTEEILDTSSKTPTATSSSEETTVQPEDDASPTDEDNTVVIPTSAPASKIALEDSTVTSAVSGGSVSTAADNTLLVGTEALITTENVLTTTRNLFTTANSGDILLVSTETKAEISTQPSHTSSENTMPTLSSIFVTASSVPTDDKTTHPATDISISATELTETQSPVEDTRATSTLDETVTGSSTSSTNKVFQTDPNNQTSVSENLEESAVTSDDNESSQSSDETSTQSSTTDPADNVSDDNERSQSRNETSPTQSSATEPVDNESDDNEMNQSSDETSPTKSSATDSVDNKSDDNERSQSSDETSPTLSSATDSVTTAVQKDVSVPGASFTSETISANEILEFFTNPTTKPSNASLPEISVVSKSSDENLNGVNELSVFTFTEAPTSKRKAGKTRTEVSNEKSKESNKIGEERDTHIENDKTTVDIAVSKESEISVNDISVIATTTHPLEENKEEGTKLFGDETFKDSNETGSKSKFPKQSKDRATFTFVEESVSRSAEERFNFSIISVTSNISDSSNFTTGTPSTERVTGTSQEPSTTTLSPITESSQDIVSGVSDSKNDTSEDVRGSTSVVDGDDKSDNEAIAEDVTESSHSDHESPTATSSPITESSQDITVTVSDSKEDTSEIGRDLTNVADDDNQAQLETVKETIRESSTTSSSITESTEGITTAVSDSENVTFKVIRELTTITNDADINLNHAKEDDLGHSDPGFTTEDNNLNGKSETTEPQSTFLNTGDDVLTDLASNFSSDTKNDNKSNGITDKDIPMTMNDDAFRFLLNDLVTPRNESVIAPVTSTSISVLMEIPSENSEETLNIPEGIDAEPALENTSTDGNNGEFTEENVSSPTNENGGNLPETESGSSFFSRVFEKSLSPSHDSNNNSQMSSIVNEGSQSESSIVVSSAATETPNSQSEGQMAVTSKQSISDRSSVELAVLENFDGRKAKDASDFTEISKQQSK